MTNKYSLIIRWSDEDDGFIAWVLELGVGVKTHGSTYEEAAGMASEIVESFFQPDTASSGKVLPHVWKYTDPADDERIGATLFPDNPHYRPASRVVKQRIA